MHRTVAFVLVVLMHCQGAVVRAEDAEDKAVAFVFDRGGKVFPNEKAPGKPVFAVDLGFTLTKDAGLKELAPLKNLTTLDLYNTEMTDAGVKELQKALPKCKITNY